MRKYRPKGSIQAKAYYTDRFHVVPSVPTQDVSTDEVFSKHLESLSSKLEVKSAYIQIGQMRVEVNHQDNYKAIELLKNECGYEMMSEMSAVDYLAQVGSLEVILSTSQSQGSERRLPSCVPELKQGFGRLKSNKVPLLQISQPLQNSGRCPKLFGKLWGNN